MALFKILKGLKANLPSNKTAGHCWYTTDDSLFYIDFEDENGEVQRKVLNAKSAEKLAGASLASILNATDLEIPTSLAVLTAIEGSAIDIDPTLSNAGEAADAQVVGEQLAGKAEVGHLHTGNDIKLYDTVSGYETIAITCASSTQHELCVELSSDTYPDLSGVSVVLTSDAGEQVAVTSAEGAVTGLLSEPNFTLSLQTEYNSADILITCTYRLDLEKTLHDYILHVDLDGETGDDGSTTSVILDTTLSLSGAAAEAKATGDAIEELKEEIAKISTSGGAGDSSSSAVQPDWSQEDSTQKDYIKNKPKLARVATAGTYASLDGKLFGDIPTILEETELTFEKVSDDIPTYVAEVDGYKEAFLGEMYRVIWDGTEYLCECKDGVLVEGGTSIDNLYFIGNKHIFWGAGFGEDTGEPFLIYVSVLDAGVKIEIEATATETHTVSITPVNTVKKLDKKYLPDGLATEEFVKAELAKIEIPEGGGSSGGGSEEVILAEQTLSFTQSTLAECYQSDVEIPFVPPVGATFTVVWDGEEYTVDGFSDSGAICLGNASICGVREDTGEPFLYAVRSPDTSENGFFFTLDESSSHTVAIYKVTASASGGVSSWNDLTDKPFWTEEVSAKVTADTVNQNVTFDGLGSTWVKGSEETLTKEEIIGASIEACSDGQIMTLPFPVAESNIVVANDNGTAVLIAEYELAFVMCYQAGEITITALGTTETVNIPEPGFYLISDVLPSTAADGGYIKICKTVVKKIDDQYQHQSDWDEEDEDSAARILNKPFGVVLAAGTVVTDCTAKYFDEDFGLMLFDLDTFERHLNGGTVVEGVSYTANLGDYEYTGIGISAAEVTEITRNTSDGGIKFLDESGNHVCTLVVNARGLFDCIPFVTEYKTLFTGGKYYPVKITVTKEVVKKIDAKYLPGPPEFDLTAMGLPALTMDGTSVTVECDTTELRAALDKGPVKLIFTANVGTEVTVSGVVNAMFMADTYQCGFVGSLTVPMLLSFEVSPTGIIGRVVSLAASTT